MRKIAKKWQNAVFQKNDIFAWGRPTSSNQEQAPLGGGRNLLAFDKGGFFKPEKHADSHFPLKIAKKCQKMATFSER